MATEDYVPVVGDDWYQRRRDDAEGAFFRHVAAQGPRRGPGTRQGIYCLTADGTLLAYKNAGQAPDVMRQTLREGLNAWRALPDSQRRPGAVRVGALSATDPQFDRTLPEGGQILKVYTRILDRDNHGQFAPGTCEVRGGDQAARDHLWLTADEVQALMPETPREGQSVALPEHLVARLLRFHLVDNTRGEPPFWNRDEIRDWDLRLTVTRVEPARVTMRLDGSALLASAADPDRANRGFDVVLLGHLSYDPSRRTLDRFDLLAVGDHWGEGPYTRRARPGRAPLGLAFELVRGDDPADRIPPQAARNLDNYLRPRY